MPHTTVARAGPHRAHVRRTVLVLLCIGLLVFLFVVGCSSDTDEAGEPTEAIYETNTEVLLNIGVERGENLGDAVDGITIEVPDSDPWQANLTYGGATRAFGDFPVDETHAFTIYPEGTSNTALEVPFTMKRTMVSGTASSKTYVTVHPDSIVVRGPAIPGERASYAW